MTDNLQALNSYTGDNIWQDVIYAMEDQDATDLIDEGTNDQFIGEDGYHYYYAADRKEWVNDSISSRKITADALHSQYSQGDASAGVETDEEWTMTGSQQTSAAFGQAVRAARKARGWSQTDEEWTIAYRRRRANPGGF